MEKNMYRHLRWGDRLKIEKMLKQGLSKKEMARVLRVSLTTVYNELHRGEYTRMKSDLTTCIEYSADVAEQKYQANLRAKGPDLKIGNDRELADYLEDKMANEKYSPAAALSAIKIEEKEFKVSISEWTLYRYIAQGVFYRLTSKDLPNGGGKKNEYHRVKAAKAPKGESIEDRPEVINERKEPGHWEMDTVESGKGSKRRLLVLTERVTRKELIRLMEDGTTASVVSEINKLQKNIGIEKFKQIFRSITVDNGSEFQDYAGISADPKTGEKRTDVYYCHPYTASERGSNENCNKLIRRWFPKGYNFSSLTVKAVKAVETWINNYPREILEDRSANMVFTDLFKGDLAKAV